MRITANSFFLIALLVTTTLAVAAPPRALIATPAGDRGLWLTEIRADSTVQPPLPISTIRFRDKSADAWVDIAQIAGQIVSATAYGSQLAVLDNGGDWHLIDAGGTSLGLPVPGQSNLQCLASDGTTIWAIARVTGEFPIPRPPTTKPLLHSSATTAPTTAEAVEKPSPSSQPQRLLILRLEAQHWQPIGELPAQFDADFTSVVEHGHLISAALLGRTISLFRDGYPLRQVDCPDCDQFDLLASDNAAYLWTAPKNGAGTLYPVEGQAQIDLATPAGMGDHADRAVSISLGRLRLIFSKSDAKSVSLFEQKYDLQTYKPIDSPVPLPLLSSSEPPAWESVVTGLTLAAMIFALVASFQHRRQVREFLLREDRPQAAPLGARTVAALIDLFPIILFTVLVKAGGINSTVPDDILREIEAPKIQLAFAIASGIYLLHTTLVEAIFGRSIGKMICGLTVLSLDGKRPTALALIGRNLLRCIELTFWPMVVMVFLSPIRQRAGDIAMGTLVVEKNPEKAKE